MNHIHIKKISLRYIVALLLGVIATLSAPLVSAFSTDTYATSSVLSQGKWVKISVSSSGMYLIPNASLSSWGFSDPKRVRIYGYGGQRISDILSLQNYVDDLPPVQCAVTARGLVFYAQGPETWTQSARDGFTHTLNPFTTCGYYFLTEDDGSADAPAIPKSGTPGATEPTTTFTDYLFHEKELTKLGETGHLLLGEDFRYTRSQSFNFTLADIDTSEPVTMRCSFVARTLSAPSSLSFSVNGKQLEHSATDNIRITANSGHSHGEMTLTSKQFKLSDSKLTLGLTYTSSATVYAAHLDYIELNYSRLLKMTGGSLRFDLANTQASLAGATAETRIWDITNPLDIKEINAQTSTSGATWTADYTGSRRYVAWNESATLPSPEYVGTVANQNLHSTETSPDMVIFTMSAWAAQAERIAALHRNSSDSLTVKVVVQDEVFNEFGSGSQDVNAFRRYLKMLYDRGLESGRPLRYALFMGKPTYDNRNLSAQIQTLKCPTMPTWQSDISLDDNTSFTTDDVFAFLKDNSGRNMGSDELCIAVGRIPVRSVDDAKTAVDKLYEYVNSSLRSSWRNQVLLLADDENNGIHMEQSEDTYQGMLSAESGDQFCYTKVYIDAFDMSGGTYPDARKRMYDRLGEGLMWWNYIGHANPTSWTGEGMLTYNDINNLYIKSYPVLYAATCSFLNWDSNDLSGAEIMYFTRQGGVIAAITAVRPVYISDNGVLGRATAPKIFERDENGKFPTIGELYRKGKNNIRDINGNISSNTNKLRYVLMGDPAMHYVTPTNRVVVEKINGVEPTEENQVTIMARQNVLLEGYVCDFDGNILTDFNGDITVDIFDAEHSTTSKGRGDEGKNVTFEEQGSRLFSGRDSVSGGRFRMSVAMPETVSNNFRPAAMNMYASSADTAEDAMGMCRTFYVFGTDDDAIADQNPPVIESLYLNHPSWVGGDAVNPSPVVYAQVSDDIGFNLSELGVGHNMSLLLDGNRSYTNVSQYFIPDLGSKSGRIAYPLEDITEGAHSLRLRVWDTSGNYSEQTIDFVVNSSEKPTLFEVTADRNPASVETNFYVTHNRPESMLNVKIEVFNLMGQLVWTNTSTSHSNGNVTPAINWNLTDMAGRRINRGIYLYRATVSEQGAETYVTKTSRIAVTAH